MTREESCLKLYEVVKAEIGVSEIPGPKANSRIVEYDSHTSLKAKSDEVPWCSSLANFVVDTAGFVGTHSAAARSWLKWGVSIEKPIKGCIVVLKRGAPPSGHVTFFVEFGNDPTYINCIGGNQSDKVKLSRYPVGDVLGYRSPV